MSPLRSLLFYALFLTGPIVNCEYEGQLIRANSVYKGVIKGVHDYFNNTCILLLHGTPDPIETQEPDKAEDLVELQRYFSSKLNVRTAIIDLQMFIDRVGSSYFHIKRPLFVLLNDYDDLRSQFAYVSTWITMSYPTWLIFLRNETQITEFLADVYVPFDCIFLVAKQDDWLGGEIIQDVYQIDRNDDLRSMTFGSWSEENGFKGPTLGLYQRRTSLQGLPLQVVSVNDPPVSLLKQNEQGEIVALQGFFGKVLELLQEGMNCTYTYIQATSWGIRLPNGTWTGALQKLVSGEADLGAMSLMMTSDRLDAIEFTTPVYSTKCRTYIKRPDSRAVKWDAYLAPFGKHIWNAIAVLIIIATITIGIIESSVKRVAVLPNHGNRTSTRVSEILFYVFGAFCNQGMEPSLLDPIRMVHLSIHLTAVIVLAAYSAALISYLAIKTFVMPFTTMEGLLKDGTYRFAVLIDSADYSFFQNTSDKVLSVMFDELLTRETELPWNYLEGLIRICREEKYAFMTMDNMAAVLQNHVPCTLEALDVMMQSTVAMAVRNRSPYKGIINANILLLRDSGILQRLLNAEWTVENRKRDSSWTSVEIEDVLPLLLFMLMALLITCLILMMERTTFRKIQKLQKSNSIMSIAANKF